MSVNHNDIAIDVKQISKIYRLGVEEIIPDSIGRTIFDFIKSPIHNYRKYRSLYKFDEIITKNGNNTSCEQDDILWALKNISFQVKKGEVIGIIGRNGAGKSTLLKILSKITDPTGGRAIIDGRVSSLLEVGTGFHRELTGRENIYLNGTVLGMTKKDIDRKFDEIVAFAGVTKFLETPVKRYSSGMTVRLAFSVAAHLEPEVLLVDEVLAVGDAAFKKKCLSKMQNVGESGRTILFVSHDMSAINRLCERTLLLDSGRVIKDSNTKDVISTYLKSGQFISEYKEWEKLDEAPGNDMVKLRGIRVLDTDGNVTSAVLINQPIDIQMEYDILQDGYSYFPHFALNGPDGGCIMVCLDQDPEWRGRTRNKGRYISTARIPGNLLAEGTMSVGPAMRTIVPDILHFYEESAIHFEVIESNTGETARGDWTKKIPGVVRPLLKWRTEIR